MGYCINPFCWQPDDPANANQRICRNCGSELILQGRYQVMRLLSDTSGFSKVYEAYEGTTPKILKVLKLQHNSNARVVQLFQQEAAVLIKLNHPGIPRVKTDGYFQFLPRGYDTPIHCLIMEKIEGINLSQWMQQQGNQPISEFQALQWLKQLAEILNLIHKNYYFHRDIKPQNIMLRPNGKLVLIDFGAAKEMTYTYLAKMGATGEITRISSAGYTPPEQEKGHAVPQSDFYALGRTFVYLLTGKKLTDSYLYDPLKDALNWRQYADHISEEFADFIDSLIATQAVNRPDNTEIILARIEQLEQQLNYLPKSKVLLEVTVNFSSSTLENSSQGTIIQKLPFLTPKPKNILAKILLGSAITILISLFGYQAWQILPKLINKQSQIIKTDSLLGHTSFINYILFSPDGQKLISASADKTIKIWDLATKKELNNLKGHTSFVNYLSITPDGQKLVSASADRTIRIWDFYQGKLLKILSGHSNIVNRVAISKDGKLLASSDVDGIVKIWNLLTEQEILTINAHKQPINGLLFTIDGQRLITASSDKTIKVWDLSTGKNLKVMRGHTGFINSVVMTPDEQKLISASADKTIRIWDFNTGKEIKTLTGHFNYVNYLVINPDGQILVSGSSDKTIKFWDLNTGKEIGAITDYNYPIEYFAISPDWQLLATGSSNKNINIWDISKMLNNLRWG